MTETLNESPARACRRLTSGKIRPRRRKARANAVHQYRYHLADGIWASRRLRPHLTVSKYRSTARCMADLLPAAPLVVSPARPPAAGSSGVRRLKDYGVALRETYDAGDSKSFSRNAVTCLRRSAKPPIRGGGLMRHASAVHLDRKSPRNFVAS